MEFQPLINLIGGAILCVLGWLARQLWEAVQTLQKDLHEIEVDLPKNYVSKEDYSATMRRIEEMVRRIDEKLDHKADKQWGTTQ